MLGLRDKKLRAGAAHLEMGRKSFSLREIEWEEKVKNPTQPDGAGVNATRVWGRPAIGFLIKWRWSEPWAVLD